jgi:predicted nucleic acid-binding protein
MSSFLLDTGPLTAYLLGRSAAVALLRPMIRRKETVTSPLVYAEVTEYLVSLRDPTRGQRQMRMLLREVKLRQLRLPILERYAVLRRQLRPPHGPGLIGDFDTMVAAAAIEDNLTLVTVDSDFQRVPGLKLLLLRSLR